MGSCMAVRLRLVLLLLLTSFSTIVLKAQVGPKCTLAVTPVSGTAGSTLFTATTSCTASTGTVDKMTLDWGDGSTPVTQSFVDTSVASIAPPPQHTYQNGGGFFVTLIGTDNNNNTGSAQQEVFVSNPATVKRVVPSKGQQGISLAVRI